MVHRGGRWIPKAAIAVKAASILNLPQRDPNLFSCHAIHAKEKQLELGVFQSIQLRDHRGPAPLDQRAEQAAQLQQVLADAGLQHHAVVENEAALFA
jgi:hypothetical protein